MQEVKLYINNQLIEFSTSPDILFTFQEDDLTNPTIVKNSYTKTVQIKGTPANNDIFGQIWDLQRIQSEVNYNATKRVPFALYVNGDIFQKGYAKLDRINLRNREKTYEITLYGGLGSFLYNLSTDWNTGDKKTLADLSFYTYSGSSEEYDLSFVINKETVEEAWDNVNSNGKWGVINFAPTYAGIPENLDADKVLINFNNSSLTSAVTSGGTAYTATQGWGLGTLPGELTSEQVRDYRSYLQTPVIRVRDVVESICDPRNNKGLYDEGYEVELDRDFFTPSNPYYWDSYMTLPLLTSLEYTSKGSGGSSGYTKNYSYVYPSNGGSEYVFMLDEPITQAGQSIKITFELLVNAISSSSDLYLYHTKVKGRGTRVYYPNAYGVQLYASDSVTQNGSVLSGSRIKWLTGSEGYEYNQAVSSGQYTPKYNAGVDKIEGYFTRKSTNVYRYATNMELECDLPVGTTCFRINIGRCNRSNNSEKTLLWTSYRPYEGTAINVSLVPFGDTSISISEIDDSEFFSNKYISKEMLLGTDYTPADWLLSYCKMFGLYLYKDVVEDKIYIKTRNNYYLRDQVIDIDKKIDHGDAIDINPVYCENGYLSLTNTGVTSRVYNDYSQKYGKVYGQKIINTGYEFNADTKELIKSVFAGATQTKEVSQYFYKPNTLHFHPYVYNNFNYLLYADGISDGETYEYKMNTQNIADVFEPYNETYPAYDAISKPMFADGDNQNLECANVLLFFTGLDNVIGYDWYLTDDNSMMYRLNNNPTWIMTNSEVDINGNSVATLLRYMPHFSRWYEGNNWMIYSFDFGSPRELYVPDMTNNDEGNIYYNYFKNYYTDLYDVDTKVVDCYVREMEFNAESLRKFYWFENTIWRLNKITDYNPTNHKTTKCQFVKVQSLDNMTNEDANSNLWVKVELDKYIAAQSGDTIIGTVKTSDNGPWNIEWWDVEPNIESGETYDLVIDPMYGGRRGNFYVTVPENTGYDKVITIAVTAGDVGASVSFIQRGQKVAFIVTPNPLEFDGSGGTLNLNINNPFGYEWRIVGKPNWVDISSMSGSSTGETLNVIAGPNRGQERTGDIVFYLPESDRTVVVQVNQDIVPYIDLNPTSIAFDANGGVATITVDSNVCWNVKLSGETVITGLTIDNFVWVSDFPNSGGSYSTKDYSTFNVMAHYDDGSSVDVTNTALISGMVTLETNTGTTRKTVIAPISANYDGLNVTEMKTGYQAGYIIMQSISIENVEWLRDIPSSGGNVQMYTNVDFDVYGITQDNERVLIDEDDDRLSKFINQYSHYFPASTVATRHSAGTINLGAEYYHLTSREWWVTAGTATTVYQEAYQAEPYLTFEILTGGTIQLNGGKTIKYRKNQSAWSAVTANRSINVSAGDIVQFKATNTGYTHYTSYWQDDYLFSGSTASFNLSGYLISLIKEDNYSANTIDEGNSTFESLFYGTKVVYADSLILPENTVSHIYEYLFSNCGSLLAGPDLPCTALTYECYRGMFMSCTGMTIAPDLPATVLADGCYYWMFSNCRNLQYIKCLATDNTASSCTYGWVNNVASSGTFVKDPNMNDWSLNPSIGIPSGWTVIDNV